VVCLYSMALSSSMPSAIFFSQFPNTRAPKMVSFTPFLACITLLHDSPRLYYTWLLLRRESPRPHPLWGNNGLYLGRGLDHRWGMLCCNTFSLAAAGVRCCSAAVFAACSQVVCCSVRCLFAALPLLAACCLPAGARWCPQVSPARCGLLV
jgi:hypothetical protein